MKSSGDFIKDELNKRGWTQSDLAMIVGRSVPAVNQLIQGNRVLSPEIAVELGAAFGTEPQVWMERESAYRLSLTGGNKAEVERRTRLFQMAPIKDMVNRQWIRQTDSIDDLERELCRFFDIPSLDAEPDMMIAARKSKTATAMTESQRAWCYRAKRLSKTIAAAPYDKTKFDKGIQQLRKLTAFPEQVKQLPRLLPAMGIRFVVVEHLPQSRIDGAAFWLDDQSPVIALSVRYDRIDCFWYTLCHELAHIRNADSLAVDDSIVGESRKGPELVEDHEKRADEQAAAMLIPSETLSSFIVRVKPFYSKTRIIQFANRLRVHPGIVTGQLQHLGEISYATNRDFLVKIRDLLVDVVLTDGWGKTLPAI